ncbi:proline--tRNA ligase [Candidatus Poribacteria bacterium]|nr:MAG: proline--tRNA ligase [Candidatus Poribacteria bacterium]
MFDKITPRSEDYSKWYTQVIRQAEMADYAPVRGCMVVRPYGYALWENVKEQLDIRFKATGHQNAAFPLFIPMSFIEKEAEHVEGFKPELAVVTHGGGKKLEEPLVVRPTSETIIGYMYSQWIQSYRDLPVLINQWANVVRWELRPRLFLRTMEFFWQEGHTAHATHEEAMEETLRILDIYTDFAVNEAAIPVIPGRKSDSEKFPGALTSYTIEAMMGDKRALQAGTSHDLGQNFAKVFDIQYLDANQKQQHCWTTSWGVSTRMIGAIIMTHGDDQGLVLPPRLAPTQLVIVPIIPKNNDEAKQVVTQTVDAVCETLDSIRYHVDDRYEYSPGWRFNEWELKGVPLRIEIGPRDIENEQVVFARRDIPGKDGKTFVPIANVAETATQMLDTIQADMLKRATEFRDANTFEPKDYDEFKGIVETGFARAWWCGNAECEDKVKEETQATIRCIPTAQPDSDGTCIVCGTQANEITIFARAY